MSGQLSPDLVTARAALLSGDRPAARRLVLQVLRQEPTNALAWLLLSGMVDTPAQQRECLQRVLRVDPANQAARRGLALLDQSAAPPVAAAGPDSGLPARDLPGAPISAAPPEIPPAVSRSSTRPRASQGPADSALRPGQPDGPLTKPRRRGPLSASSLMVIGLVSLLALAGGYFVLRGGPTAPISTVSAQTRATDFINGLLSFTTRPEFYDHTRRDALLAPLVARYAPPGKRMRGLINVSNGLMEGMSSAEQTQFLQTVERMYVAEADYAIESQSATALVLRVQSGSIWYLFRNGRSTSVPLIRAIDKVYLSNIEGVWYIDDISAPGS